MSKGQRMKQLPEWADPFNVSYGWANNRLRDRIKRATYCRRRHKTQQVGYAWTRQLCRSCEEIVCPGDVRPA